MFTCVLRIVYYGLPVNIPPLTPSLSPGGIAAGAARLSPAPRTHRPHYHHRPITSMRSLPAYTSYRPVHYNDIFADQNSQHNQLTASEGKKET